MSVFVGVEEEGGGTRVFNARDYQAKAFVTFMSSDNIVKIYFNYPGNTIFNLQKFNTSGLTKDYHRFCILENEKGEKHILSDNEELLRGFVGWKNRITAEFGGSKRKPVPKKKSTKRKSTKRKSIKKK